MADKEMTRKAMSDFIVALEKARTELATQTLKRQRIELKKIQLDREIVTFEANVMYNIATSTDEDGKPTFSNETLRKAQASLDLSAAKDYQDMLAKSDRIRKQIYRYKCEEEITYTEIKKLESLERLYFYDLESEVRR